MVRSRSDHLREEHAHDWHQLTFALRGHLEVETREARALVPPDCAVWVPAGLAHRESMWAPVAVRTLYLAPGATPAADTRSTRTLAIAPLLRLFLAETGPGDVSSGCCTRSAFSTEGRLLRESPQEVGYATPSAFTAAFVRRFGRPPTGR